jgi:hypothetical protein
MLKLFLGSQLFSQDTHAVRTAYVCENNYFEKYTYQGSRYHTRLAQEYV